MEIIELLLIIVGCLALVVAIATAIIKVSSFYRTQFGFSVWSGVLLLFLAFVLMLIYYGGEKPQSTYYCPFFQQAYVHLQSFAIFAWQDGDMDVWGCCFRES